MNITPEFRMCPRCKWEGNSDEKLCPRCDNKTMTSSFLRATGAFLFVIGGGLVGTMCIISVFVIGAMNQSGKPGNGVRFTGSKSDMLVIFVIFGFVILFGVISMATGLWQLIYGRRNMVLVYAILVLGFIFLAAGSLAQGLLD